MQTRCMAAARRKRELPKWFTPVEIRPPLHEHPEVAPQVSHLRQVPLRIKVKLPHSSQLSPS
jgi:hypothetical protein